MVTVVPPGLSHTEASLVMTTPGFRLLERLCQEEVQRQGWLKTTTWKGQALDMALQNPWIERTKWAQTYDQACLPVPWGLSAMPDPASRRDGLFVGSLQGQDLFIIAERERQLQSVLNAVDLMFERCQETGQHTEQYVLQWLRSFYSSRPYPRPFQLVGRHSSFKKYFRI